MPGEGQPDSFRWIVLAGLWLIYSAFGSGNAPVAPGTAGSAVAALFLLLPGRAFGLPPWENPVWGIAVLAVILGVSWVVSLPVA